MKRVDTAAPVAEGADDKAGETPLRSGVRARIFDTACELFYNQGIRSVGVDAIVSEAGTNKMSFYRSFGSKDELVAEYLRNSEREFWDWWDAAIAPYAGDPRRQCEALFDSQILTPCDKNLRGCPMVNAAVEIREEDHPALQVVRDHKSRIRDRFLALAQAMRAPDPEGLGDALVLLMSGSVQSRLIFPCDSGPARQAAEAARRLIDSYLAG